MKLFRLSAAAVVIAVTFLAASSAHAVVIIQASETGGNVVFTLSGWVNLSSVSANFATEPGSNDIIWPSAGRLFFGSTQNNNGNVYDVPNLIGPSNFGPGNVASVSVTNTGSIFNFFAPTPNGGMLLGASYTSGSSLSNTMTFPGTFASLGMTPGIYVWSWSNAGVSDSLVLIIGPAGPITPASVVMLPVGAGGVAPPAPAGYIFKGFVPLTTKANGGGPATGYAVYTKS